MMQCREKEKKPTEPSRLSVGVNPGLLTNQTEDQEDGGAACPAG